MTIGLLHYLTLGAILFGIGLYGVLTKRNSNCHFNVYRIDVKCS